MLGRSNDSSGIERPATVLCLPLDDIYTDRQAWITLLVRVHLYNAIGIHDRAVADLVPEEGSGAYLRRKSRLEKALCGIALYERVVDEQPSNTSVFGIRPTMTSKRSHDI